MIKNHSANLELLTQAQVGNEDQFMALFDCYSSLVKRLWQRFYIADLELEDWEQEAQLVLLKVIYSYNGKDINQFSGFYTIAFLTCIVPGKQINGSRLIN